MLELLRAGQRAVQRLVLVEDLEPSPQLDEIERLAAQLKLRTEYVGRSRLESMARTDAPQGVLALARPLEEADLDDLASPGAPRPPLLLVLDGITDPHNLGALLRTAECAGVTGVVLPRHRAARVTPTAAKVAAGAIEHVRIAIAPGIPAALSRLVDAGVCVVGLDASAEQSLFELGAETEGPVALVLGAEGRGLAPLTRKRCTVLAGIPHHGRIESLNVASAGAVACFEMARRRRRSHEPVAGVPPH